MALVEGIGDEVVLCGACLVILLLSYLIWISLPIHQGPIVRVTVESSVAEPQDVPTRNQEILSASRSRELRQEGQHQFIDSVETLPQRRQSECSETDRCTTDESLQETDSEVVENHGDEVRKKRLEFYNGCTSREEVPLRNGEAAFIPEGENSSSPLPEELQTFPLRLKYLDDTERTVFAQPSESIGDFRRCHFTTELSNNKTIRLIYRGQVLRDEGTLQSYGLGSGCCIHVQVVNRAQGQTPDAQGNEAELDLGQFLWPLLGVFLGVLWMCHFHYREYFATSSTVALFGLSGLFLTVVWGQYTSRPERIGR